MDGNGTFDVFNIAPFQTENRWANSASPGLCHGAATEMDRSAEAGWILDVTQAVQTGKPFEVAT